MEVCGGSVLPREAENQALYKRSLMCSCERVVCFANFTTPVRESGFAGVFVRFNRWRFSAGNQRSYRFRVSLLLA